MLKHLALAFAMCVAVLDAASARPEILVTDCNYLSDKTLWEQKCTETLSIPALQDRERAEAHYLRGFARFYAKNYADALQDFEAALSLAPNYHRAHRLVGVTLMRQGKGRAARRSLLRSIELYPDGYEAYSQLALLEYKMGFSDAALEYCNRAIELKPDLLYARLVRTGILLDKQRFKDTLQDTEFLMRYSQAELDDTGSSNDLDKPTSVYESVQMRHARALANIGRFEESERIADALVNASRRPVTLLVRAIVLSRVPNGMGYSGRTEDVLRNYREALEIDPSYNEAWRRLALRLQYVARHEEALEASERAIRTARYAERTPILFWERARMLRSLKRTEDAVNTGIIAWRQAFLWQPASISVLAQGMRSRGYWLGSSSPQQLDRDLIDAITACMHDRGCR